MIDDETPRDGRAAGNGGGDGREFHPGDVIKLYGVYRCTCGQNPFFGVSGRRFPRAHCSTGTWQMVLRAREEKFF